MSKKGRLKEGITIIQERGQGGSVGRAADPASIRETRDIWQHCSGGGRWKRAERRG